MNDKNENIVENNNDVENPNLVKDLYNEIIERVKKYHPAKDLSIIEKAVVLAENAHKSQKRKSGEPYIIHPLKVAYILADLELDIESIVAGILHDTIEDTPYTYEDIVELFGEEVAILVEGVTKLTKLNYSVSISKEEVQADNYRKMFIAMAKDIRVILIKLADRLHNMRTLDYMTPKKQMEKAQETLDIYAPLANRLGIAKIKVEMEDLCFKYLYPDEYKEIYDKIQLKKIETENYVNEIIHSLSQKLENLNLKGKIYGRNKHLFSIYKKMKNQNKAFDQIYDLFAVRVIVKSVRDCYGVLGVIHDMYKPMPGRFKDYIAMPKVNMYQSLHNTLIGPTGEPFEVQIRTEDMHRTNEFGIAAHWKYKEGTDGHTSDKEQKKLEWLKQILEWQKDMSDNKEFMDTIKTDLNIYDEQVYAFTPQGDVISLPNGATPIDFAYFIHSAIGNKMVGARVNGKIVTFDYKVSNGDRIEIVTSQNSKGPNLGWLNIVKSSQAKSKINQWFKKEFKEENIIKGKELILADIKRKGYSASDVLKPEWLETVCKKFAFKEWDALCAGVGHGGLKEGQVVNRLLEEYQKEEKKQLTGEDIIKRMEITGNKKATKTKKGSNGVSVKGVDELAVRFSHCCNPVPGDEIIGFVTRGRGVSIHRTDCVNIINLDDIERNRLIDTEWEAGVEEDANVAFTTEIRLICTDRNSIILDISRVLSEENILVKSFNARTAKDSTVIFNITMQVNGKEELEFVCKKFMNIQGVDEIERAVS